MFFGIFIVAAGIISLLEAYGVVSNVKWGLPLAIICFGLSIVWDSLNIKRRKSSTN